MSEEGFKLYPGKYEDKIDRSLRALEEHHIIQRIRKHDHTIWKESPEEISNRLGWLISPETTLSAVPEIEAFVQDIRSGFKTVLLLGMGGSSLAPEVFRKAFAPKDGYPELLVLDTTDPDAINMVETHIDLKQTHFIVATKSGGTVETISLMKYFYNRVHTLAGINSAGSYFSAITDPGSGLEKQAAMLNFRKIFLNDPNIGGRYSALSLFGMVPAALLGIDISVLLNTASAFADRVFSMNDQSAAVLGTMMGVLAKEGRDKITLLGEKHWKYIRPWIEQLIAESTGKEGKGILPVDREKEPDPEKYSHDRLFVYIQDSGKSESPALLQKLRNAGHPVVELFAGGIEHIGTQFFLWEMATVISGYFLQINPFDQPDVESAKVRARQLMDKYKETGEIERPKISHSDLNFDIFGDDADNSPSAILRNFIRESLQDGGYISIHAYLAAETETDEVLMEFCDRIRSAFIVPATLGYGPRFLHSTGQLHKGDAGKGVFLQILNIPSIDLDIPDEPGSDESSISFGNLRNAQAFGDREALISCGRKVLTILVKQDLKEILSLL